MPCLVGCVVHHIYGFPTYSIVLQMQNKNHKRYRKLFMLANLFLKQKLLLIISTLYRVNISYRLYSILNEKYVDLCNLSQLNYKLR